MPSDAGGSASVTGSRCGDGVGHGDRRAGARGRVVLVGTPIGNLGDLSHRAVEALATADAIYCEDTRRTRRLLTHAGISGVRLRSLHEHNEAERTAEVLRRVAAGDSSRSCPMPGCPEFPTRAAGSWPQPPTPGCR